MSYPPKLHAALAQLETSGIRPSAYSPPLHRLLWRLGVILPPPHFASFGFNFFFAAVWFGVLWGALMWFTIWSRQGMSALAAVISALFAGGLFGLGMAAYYHFSARKHNLPGWSQIRAEQ